MSGSFHQNAAARFEVVSFDDSGGENYATVLGLTDERLSNVIHIQPHGFSSVPVAGAHMLGVSMNGQRDSIMLLGGESSSHKPTGLGSGNTAFYNADGTIMKMIGKNVVLNASGDVTYTVKSITFKAGGNTLVFSAAGLYMNGVNVGDTHKHGKVVKGGDETDVPV